MFMRDVGGSELSMDDLRVVARYVVESAEHVLAIFEREPPDDVRPRAAVEAGWEFARGAKRTKLLRVTALEAHRAANEASTESAKHAANSAGDAAAAAYLHPPDAVATWTSARAKEAQVLHILRPVAHAARAAELSAGDDRRVGDELIVAACERAPRELIDILRRYPRAPDGTSRVATLAKTLDSSLRARESNWRQG